MKFGYLENVDNIKFELPKNDGITQRTLSKLEATIDQCLYIGTSVFSDPSFKGTIYPNKTSNSKFLAEYTKQFNCIEVNSTRFGTPSLKTQQDWLKVAPSNFKFCFKMPQVITHRKNMLDDGGIIQTDKFLECLLKFGDNAGMTYMLLPNYFKEERLPMLLKFLDKYPTDLPLSIEARNDELHKNKTFIDYLLNRNITLAITDVSGRRDVLHSTLTTDSVIIRFAGANLHPSDYQRIEQWVDKIVSWMEQGLKTVYFFIHQPSPYKYKSGILAAYMIERLNSRIPNLNLKAPIDYS